MLKGIIILPKTQSFRFAADILTHGLNFAEFSIAAIRRPVMVYSFRIYYSKTNVNIKIRLFAVLCKTEQIFSKYFAIHQTYIMATLFQT